MFAERSRTSTWHQSEEIIFLPTCSTPHTHEPKCRKITVIRCKGPFIAEERLGSEVAPFIAYATAALISRPPLPAFAEVMSRARRTVKNKTWRFFFLQVRPGGSGSAESGN